MTETDTDAQVIDLARARHNQLDAKLDRVLSELATQGRRLSSVEGRMTQLEKTGAHGFAELNDRLDILQGQIDGVGTRIERIERRLDLAEMPLPR